MTGDTVTWTKGRHSFSFGGDFRAHQVNSHNGSGALSFDFTENTTGVPNAAYAPICWLWLCEFSSWPGEQRKRNDGLSTYTGGRSQCRFLRRTITRSPQAYRQPGLRWDYNFRFHEKYGHWANFDLKAIDPSVRYPGKMVFANGGGDSFEKNEYAKNFGPQIGFAYSPLPENGVPRIVRHDLQPRGRGLLATVFPMALPLDSRAATGQQCLRLG